MILCEIKLLGDLTVGDIFLSRRVADQEHDEDQEDEEEAAEESGEAGHTGSAAEVTEAECKSQREEK